MNKAHTKESLYSTDFCEWAEEQAEILRSGDLSAADRENLAEEIEALAKRDQREVRSRIITLVLHLIKWAVQPTLREKSTWMATINEQRTQLRLLFQDSPSLENIARNELWQLYMAAVRRAERETNLRVVTLDICPFTLEQFLDEEWLPPDIPSLPAVKERPGRTR